MDTLKYKLQLEAMLEELTGELSAIGIHNPENPQDWIAVPEGMDVQEADSDLVADVVEEWDERQGLVATLEKRYNDVTRALGKIEMGTFGVCEISGEPIEETRLDANPAARTNIAHMNEEGMLRE
jgi:RNA polymerase-binding transcription factor DksA